MLVKTVSKYTVSLENPRLPELGEKSKSLRHELQSSRKAKQIKKYKVFFILSNSVLWANTHRAIELLKI